MSEIDLSYAIGLKPEKAILYFKSKGYKITGNWYEMWQQAHAKAFTVANVARMDVLQDIRGTLQKSLDDGLPLSEFKKELLPQIARKGWGASGVDMQTLNLANPWRMRTIYNTNMQSNYMAGRYKTMMDNIEDRPYWMYVAIMDSRTRLAHAAMHGRVYRHDDPFWKHFYPPNGFG